MTEKNSFVEALAPFYSAEGLSERGIEDTEGLIGMPTTDGLTIYSERQFRKNPDGTFRLLEKANELWHKLLLPAVNDGSSDAWTAAVVLLAGDEENPSLAEQVEQDPSQEKRVTWEITKSVTRWRL